MKNNILITHQIHYLARILERNADAMLRKNFGVDFIDFLMFHTLLEAGTLTQNDIATAMGYTKSLVSKRLSTLISRGLAELQVNAADRRENFVTLSDSGKSLIYHMNIYLEDEFLNMFSSQDVDMKTFSISLTQIINTLDPSE